VGSHHRPPHHQYFGTPLPLQSLSDGTNSVTYSYVDNSSLVITFFTNKVVQPDDPNQQYDNLNA